MRAREVAMKVRMIMTPHPFVITPDDSVSYAAEVMRHQDIGALPVVDSVARGTLVGLITDRDIVIRCVSRAHDPKCPVGGHMTTMPLEVVREDADVDEVVEKMERLQVRRIPVLDEQDVLVGIVAQADLVRKLGPADPEKIEEVLERVSAPAVPVA
jgi:CBS domain-containing protein